MQIDNSQLTCFINCPRAYRNRYVLKLRKAVDDKREMYLNWGSAIHKALEAYYKLKGRDEALKVFNDTFPPLEGDKIRTPNHGIELLTNYFNYYEGNTNELGDKHLTTLAVETKDTFKIGDVEWLVKIDRVVKCNAGILVLDHKSTMKSLYTFVNTFTPNTQVSGYVDYVIKKYGQCSGFIPDILQYGYREKAYKGEPAGFHFQFQRDIVNRTKEQIDDFETNVKYWSRRLQEALDNNEWGKNESNCSRCGFRELCVSCDDEEVKAVIYETYNPTEYLDV